MKLGASKYEELCAVVREQLNADGIVLVVIEVQENGRGRVNIDIEATDQVSRSVPRILLEIADTAAAKLRAEGSAPQADPGLLQGEWETVSERGLDMEALVEGVALERPHVWHRLTIDQQTVWIEPRPSYCDRGRYHANYQGSFYIDHGDGFPRYYMDLEVAKQEMKAWLLHRIACQRRKS